MPEQSKHSYPESQLFGEPFKVARFPEKAHRLALAYKDEQGETRYGRFSVRALHFRESQRPLPLEGWRRTRSRSDATFFRAPSGKTVVVKSERGVWPGEHDEGKGLRLIPVMRELLRRKVMVEVPVAYIETHEGVNFYVVKAVEGKDIADFLGQATAEEKKEIAGKMGKVLADMHNKGVAHMHPHGENWIVEGGRPRLIDVKGVSFEREFPKPVSEGGRTISWEQAMENDRIFLTTWLQRHEGLQKAFEDSYNKWRKA